MLNSLSSSLKNTLKKIANSVFVDERLIDELIKDIQRALLQADVNVKFVLELTKNIKKKALEEKLPPGINRKEHIIKVVYDELVQFLGKDKSEIKIDKSKKPFKIMLVGLFGSGKTTTTSKLAKYYRTRGYKTAIVGLDTFRPAAMIQIEQLAKQIDVPYFINVNEKDAVKLYNQNGNKFKDFDILIIDTAGRDSLNDDLIKEIDNINKTVNPDENLLVISADIGQTAQQQAQKFHDTCDITGIIITKMDSTAKAGGALTASAITESPVKFITTGEKVDDIEIFNPTGFVSRLLGMGDLEALLEKAETAFSGENVEEISSKLLKGEFNFIDLYEQVQSMKKMGSLSKIIDLIPGMGNMEIPKDMLDVQEDKLKRWRYIFDSMTKEELEDPELLDGSRIQRISKGSGIPAGEIRELLKQYRMSKKMMKSLKGGKGLDKMMKKFQGKLAGL